MLLIGSLALNSHAIDTGRMPKDWDYIATYDEFHQWIADCGPAVTNYYPLSENKFVAFFGKTPQVICEFEIAWPNSTAEQLLRIEEPEGTASLEACLALKLSHRYLKNSPAFRKTMDDIWLLRNHGVKITARLKDWLAAREKETYAYSHPSLNRSKMEFFDPSVKYTYDHDAVHRAVQQLDRPAYEYYKSDNAEVQCSKSKFFALPEEIRLFGVLEEAYVLALERSIIPHPGVLIPKQAFDKALEKVCTSITSGWFREFSWEHYHQVRKMYDDDYVIKFWQAVAQDAVPLACSSGGK